MKSILTGMMGVMEMSLDGSTGLWWISIPLAIFFLLAIGDLIRRRVKLQRVTLVLCAVLVVAPVVFSAMAVLFAADHHSPTAVEDTVIPVRVLEALGLASLIAVGSCIYMSKKQRVAATSIALFGGWLVYWIYFVAAMSVSGIWL
jgi:hypothetical protein